MARCRPGRLEVRRAALRTRMARGHNRVWNRIGHILRPEVDANGQCATLLRRWEGATSPEQGSCLMSCRVGDGGAEVQGRGVRALTHEHLRVPGRRRKTARQCKNA